MTGPILVFGGGGQLGQEIAARAARDGIDVFPSTRINADIIDSGAVARLIGNVAPRLIVNCAAYTAVDKAESEPDAAAAANIAGAAVVAREAAIADIPIVHFSTDYVFDGAKHGAYVEGDPIAPLNVYGRTKADGEEQVRRAAARHIILRTAWVYGRFGHNFLKTILRLSREQHELRIIGDQHGCPTATGDLAAAVFAIDRKVVANAHIEWGTYHFAGEGVTSWAGFADEIIKTQRCHDGCRPRIASIKTSDYPTPARRPQNSELDSRRFAKMFGYRAGPWRERVNETVAALTE